MTDSHSNRAQRLGEAGYQLLARGVPLLLLLAAGHELWQLLTTPGASAPLALELWVSPPLLLAGALSLWRCSKAAPLLLAAYLLLTLLPLWFTSHSQPASGLLFGYCALAGLGLLLSLLHHQRQLLR